jgi:hypothetical protein
MHSSLKKLLETSRNEARIFKLADITELPIKSFDELVHKAVIGELGVIVGSDMGATIARNSISKPVANKMNLFSSAWIIIGVLTVAIALLSKNYSYLLALPIPLMALYAGTLPNSPVSYLINVVVIVLAVIIGVVHGGSGAILDALAIYLIARWNYRVMRNYSFRQVTKLALSNEPTFVGLYLIGAVAIRRNGQLYAYTKGA